MSVFHGPQSTVKYSGARLFEKSCTTVFDCHFDEYRFERDDLRKYSTHDYIRGVYGFLMTPRWTPDDGQGPGPGSPGSANPEKPFSRFIL